MTVVLFTDIFKKIVRENKMNNPTNFHLKPEITWGHLISTLLLFGAIIGLYENNGDRHSVADKRITVVEMQITDLHEQALISRSEMNDRLKSIDTKLDRLLDKLIK